MSGVYYLLLPIRGRSPETVKGVPCHLLKYMKYMKGVGNLFRSVKGPTGRRDAYHGCEKVEKTHWFCD